jgi:hypothetical protein
MNMKEIQHLMENSFWTTTATFVGEFNYVLVK